MKMKKNYGFPAVGSCRALTVNILYNPETMCVSKLGLIPKFGIEMVISTYSSQVGRQY